MGTVTDSDKAFNSCRCYIIDKDAALTADNLVCFSKGCRGFLSANQKNQCKNIEIQPASAKLSQNMKRIQEVGNIMRTCMGREGDINFFNNCLQAEINQMLE